MLGTLIRNLGSVFYRHPVIGEDILGRGAFGRLKIALVADYFTSACLAVECRIKALTPQNYQNVIRDWKPDFVFVESVFHGKNGAWRYKMAKQPKLLRLNRSKAICRLVRYAQDRGVPTIFWNKDDGVFFNAFIDMAVLFDHVVTTDSTCLERYKQHLPKGKRARVLAMPYQPAFHFFSGFHFQKYEACFVGSYYQRILQQRKQFLNLIFDACEQVAFQVNVFDRNSHRFSRLFEFRFPNRKQLKRHVNIPYEQTGLVYKSHLVSLNVNSVTDSESMCSRRLLEILACGGIAVTNPSLAVSTHFYDYCHVVATAEEAQELFSRLQYGPSKEDLERAKAGADYVRFRHTWEHRLEELGEFVNF